MTLISPNDFQKTHLCKVLCTTTQLPRLLGVHNRNFSLVAQKKSTLSVFDKLEF